MFTSTSTLCSGCGKPFKAGGGLVKHQKSCEPYQEQDRRRLSRWRDKQPTFVASGDKRRRVEVAVPEAEALEEATLTPVDSHSSIVADPDPSTSRMASPEPVPRIQGRSVRSNRGKLPARYNDFTPQGPSPLPCPPDLSSPPSTSLPVPESNGTSSSSGPFTPGVRTRTAANTFGLMREYWGALPATDPEDELSLADLLDDSAMPRDSPRTPRGVLIAPYPNMSSYLFGKWFWNGSAVKSEADRDNLLDNCILHPEFQPGDLRDVNWKKIDRALGASEPGSEQWGSRDGWVRAEVPIKVPFGKDTPPAEFNVHGLAYRPLEEVIASVCSSELSAGFHYTPYELLWQPPTAPNGTVPPVEQVYGELYSSQVFRDAHAELQSSPGEPGCSLPRAIIACMPWSDSTHLAEYGNASLWPIYLLFGNQSKYARGRPSMNACHHVAYIPKLPDNIEDFLHLHTAKQDVSKILTHCRRELMHGIWRLLLGDRFEEACRHGIVVKCFDGITRRLYPRFFTYSADYPEKVLLATVRDMGNCPCPRCLVLKSDIHLVARQADVNAARALIYNKGKGITSVPVERYLKETSQVPVINAFSERLKPWLPNFYKLFVPDFLHEWELGVWKNIMIHLIRILHAEKGAGVRELNLRFRQVPVFGRDTIRRFSNNLAELKQMAARDYEDSLQCFIPVVEALLPEPHNSAVLDLLFDTASLHGLHKLRMHVASTVQVTDAFFIIFTNTLRRFKQDTCAAYKTTELPKEARARTTRQQGKLGTTGVTIPPIAPATARAEAATPRQKEFNMNTYKLHSLGDYTPSITTVGTQDSYSSQTGELAHRILKRRFARTSKKAFVTQMTDMERRESRLQHITHTLATGSDTGPSSSATPHGPQTGTSKNNNASDADDDYTEGENAPMSQHHYIARSQKVYEYIPHFVRVHMADPAAKNFVVRLKDHIVRRLSEQRDNEGSSSVSEDQRREILFEHDRLYCHRTMRVNYTTYDANEDQSEMTDSDSQSSTSAGGGSSDPTLFWYAQVLGIYHVNVFDFRKARAPPPKRVEFLHIRWFGRDPDWRCGWQAKRLERIGYVPESDGGAFDFLDPADVIRACHLIPAFAEGRTATLLGPSSLARPHATVHEDWERYYVNRFVDRDMLLRYLGGAVGHRMCVTAAALAACEAASLATEECGTVVGPSSGNPDTGDLPSVGSSHGPSDTHLDDNNDDQDDEQEAGDLDEDLDDSGSDGYDSDVPFALL
ncbi:hypothetical protein VTO73DRAFT_9613 [Trametes versicolor]